MFKHLYLKLDDNIKSNSDVYDEFEPHYVNNNLFSIKYKDRYFVSAEKPPRYCDINVTYVTTNFYYYQKYRHTFSFKFLPYMIYINAKLTQDLVNTRKEKTNIREFSTDGTYTTGNYYNLPFYKVLNSLNINMCCDNLIINVLSETLPIDKIIYAFPFANKITLNDDTLPMTNNEKLISELCEWLGCTYIGGVINTTEMDVEKYNRLLTVNNDYMLDYVFEDNKNIDANMTYLEFLSSNIW